MTRYDLISFNRELLKKLADRNINTIDYRYADLYDDYKALLARGEKVTYIVSLLSEKYLIGERSVYRIINSLEEIC